MTGQFVRSTRPLLSVARSNIELSATLAAMAVGAAIVPPMTGGRHVTAAHRASDQTPVFSRLSEVPSHNGIYRASLLPSPEGRRRGSDVWVVEIRTMRDAPVEGATLAVESWMPDDARSRATTARVTTYLGEGRYRVEGLRLDGRGWRNVRLGVVAPNGTDSLAFNLIR
jgi:hypothetical protein